DYEGDDAILPGAYWLSNVHELFSFVNTAENDMLREVDLVSDSSKKFEWDDYGRLVSIAKHDLQSLEYNIYRIWVTELKKRLYKMIIPAVIESQSLPNFKTGENNRFNATAFSMDDLLIFLNKVRIANYVEMSVIDKVITELLKLVG
ncbi:12296_t:CDS:1, partial [Dentiscutata heterogama]